MERFAFRMVLNPNQGDEYKRRHDDLWPELVENLRSAASRTIQSGSIRKTIICSPRCCVPRTTPWTRCLMMLWYKMVGVYVGHYANASRQCPGDG